ncbi:SAF domain protein [mine drainage metagenome]|uniref:SAF domain protein n=1 Tax=mine drainage metagenome TaxID=410659 RepID=A0A1J5S7Z7_9ZZZZ
MRPATLVTIVAVLAAGITALLAKSWLDRQTAPRPAAANSVAVVVLARAVPPGAALTADDLRDEPWPAALVPPRLIRENGRGDAKAAYVGRRARRALEAGEPLDAEALSDQGDLGALAALLHPGMRAVSVSITNASAVSGFITPGDHVDVVLAADLSRTLEGNHPRPGQAVLRYASETVLTNVRVLAIDQALSRAKDGETRQGKTATLEVSPVQAQTLATADLLGSLDLVLRGRAAAPGAVAAPTAAAPPFSADLAVSDALRHMVGQLAPPAAPHHAARAAIQINRAGVITAQGVPQ